MSELLTIYQTQSLDEIPKAKKHIGKIEKILDLQINKKQEHIPAVVGGIAGIGLELFTNQYLSAVLNIVGLIQLSKQSWSLIKAIHKAGKTCDIKEEFAKALSLNRALKAYKRFHREEYEKLTPDKIIIADTKNITPENKDFIAYCYQDNFDDEGREFGYFSSITFMKKDKEHITYYFIVRIDGKINAIFSHWHE